MQVYIKGIGNISPQNSIDNKQFPGKIAEHNGEYLKCIEPDYKEYISPVLLRRMSRIIKMGITASKICLHNANIKIPGAIITGTGFGCLEDTEKFLTSLIKNDEKLLIPLPFIQSTHNTISAQIAIMLKCYSYNNTYVHRNFSFESALLDGILLLKEYTADNVLIGGIDEITPVYYTITKRLGLWKKEKIKTPSLPTLSGVRAGEGAAFFLLTNKEHKENYAKICSVSTIYENHNNNTAAIERHISKFLINAEIELKDIDLIILGINGDSKYDAIYYQLMENYFNRYLKKNICTYYKHLCGEYHTSSSFALWLGANIIKKQYIPDIIYIPDPSAKTQWRAGKSGQKTQRGGIKNVLIYNHYKNVNHSLILLTKC